MRNTKLLTLIALAVGLSLVMAVSAMAATEKTPKEMTTLSSVPGEIITKTGDVLFTKQAAPGDTVWIRVHDDDRCDETGSPTDGGQGVGLAPGYGTWCWERGLYAPGAYDSCSSTTFYGGSPPRPGCFTHYDVYTLLANQWHLDTFMNYPLGGAEDSTPWCGEFGDPLVWKNDWGYGPQYNWSIILNLGDQGDVNGFNAATGFTVGGVHLYDVEIAYDYCYLEYSLSNDVNTAIWFEMARYNGTSLPDSNCSGTGGADYGCAQYDSFTVVGPPANNATNDLMVRWRFASDSAWDDEDASGGVHTLGAWRIDHIWAEATGGTGSYPFDLSAYEDFESGLPAEWSTPTLPQAQIGGYWTAGVWVNGTPVYVDWWHLELDPNYANKGNTCEYSNNWMWDSADEATNVNNTEDSYHYRLVTPVFETGVNNPYWDPDGNGSGDPNDRWTGVAVESDQYLCIKSNVGDVTDTQVRVFDGSIQRWSQWNGDNYVIVGGCQFWNVDQTEDWSEYLGENIDSIQFSWEFLDRCDYNAASKLPCMGTHRKAVYIVDNMSVGVFESTEMRWAQGASEAFADTYARDVAMHSLFKENWELFPTDIWEQEDSMTIQVRDPDGVMGGPPPLNSSIKICWRISTNCGQTWDKEPARPFGATQFPSVPWNVKTCNFSVPDDPEAVGTKAEFNGVYSTIVTVADNSAYLGGGTLWPEGTIIEYFFTGLDSTPGAQPDTVPNRNSLARNSLLLVEDTPGKEHDRRNPWPFNVRVLPCPTSKDPLPDGQNQRVLLVDSFGRAVYDVASDEGFDFAGIEAFPTALEIYSESLDRLGIQYDTYREGYGVSRGTAPIYSQPFDHDGYGGVINHNLGTPARRYDTVIYFFGEFNYFTVVDSTQLELATFIDKDGVNFPGSANVWVIGDDLCEDDGLTDPTWVDGNGVQTTNGAHFWTVLCGLAAVPGGCPDDGGHISTVAPGTYKYYLTSGGTGPLAGITKAAGYWDCPFRKHPDDGANASTATPILKYANDLKSAMFLKTHPSGSKVVLSFISMEFLASVQERDCVTQGILGSGCFNVGIPTPRTNCTIGPTSGVPDVPSTDRLVLHQNRPNPFNPVTNIKFNLPSKSKATLKIYDIAGREVRTLVDGTLESGEHNITWFGKDNNGRDVTSGVYFYRLDAGKETSTKKMVLLR
ncbi:MAG: T9SS type A sorting domain-containing protein [Candidatus Eisenbacteria bacterium]